MVLLGPDYVVGPRARPGRSRSRRPCAGPVSGGPRRSPEVPGGPV